MSEGEAEKGWIEITAVLVPKRHGGQTVFMSIRLAANG
jgi:hypothetical protein